MANASCASCTLVSNVLTLAGSVSGTVVVGMTPTGPGVPAGVSVTSFGTGAGGAGTYNCSASAANVTSAEAMVFSLSWDMPLQGNSSAPQLFDLGRAAGFGLVFVAAITGSSAGPGQEYHHGTHAVAIHQAQAIAGSHVFQSVKGKQGVSVTPIFVTPPQYPEPRPSVVFDTTDLETAVGKKPLVTLSAAPQAYDFTLAAFFNKPLLNIGNCPVAEYQFGIHQESIYNSQISAQIFKPVINATPLANIVPRTVLVPPQNVDLTIQGWSKIPSVSTGWLVTMITSGPQLADLTQQAQLIPARPFLSAFTGPVSPKTIVSVNQADPTQVPARSFAPPTRAAPVAPKPFITASPDLRDYTQPQGRLILTALPGPSKKLQPAFVYAFEQQYDKNLYPVAFQQAIQVGGTGPVNTGFRVIAVTAGHYAGVFRTPGDVFDIAQASDYSDSTIDYQPPSSNTTGYGWMLQVPATTPLFNWLSANPYPALPPQDPNRRFIM